LADFHRVFSMPLEFMRGLAQARGQRLRLLPPYREHLGQALARYFTKTSEVRLAHDDSSSLAKTCCASRTSRSF